MSDQTTDSGDLIAQMIALLSILNVATGPQDMSAPGWKLHKLYGNNPKGQSVESHWTVSVSGNWRLTFCFDGTDAILVDYQDYH